MQIQSLRFKVQSVIRLLLVSALAFGFPVFSHGQGTFQNLDFESANLTPIPQGQQGSLAPISAGLPGWTGFLGSSQTTQVFHNGLSTGAASIDILGPNFGTGPGGIIDGSFTAVLQAGDETAGDVAATISQNGVVPGSSKALLFDAFANVSGFLTVSFNGQNVPYQELSVGPNFQVYGADISTFAGQTGTLSFSEIPNPLIPSGSFASVFLDDIAFSLNPIPEPGTCALLLCGAAAVGVNRWRKQNANSKLKI